MKHSFANRVRLATWAATWAALCAGLVGLSACGVGYEVGGGGSVGDGSLPPPGGDGGGGGGQVVIANSLIAAGTRHTCVVDAAGTVACWGANDLGQLGNGTRTGSPRALVVPGLQKVVSVTAGGDHSCALQEDGLIFCWGAGLLGQLGQGRFADSLDPVVVTGLPAKAVSVAAGKSHTCAITDDAKVRCWGSNASGQLSRPTTGAEAIASSRLPLLIPGLGGDAVALGAGFDHTCAARAVGAPRCWGANAQGQLGNGTASAVGTALNVQGLPGNLGVRALAGGSTHSCALVENGQMFCWGSNSAGELGNGTASAQPALTAVAVAPLPGRDYVALSLGDQFSCAVSALRALGAPATGRAACWGQNVNGELGQDSLVVAASNTPVNVRTLDAFEFLAVGAGANHACAIDASNRLRCWGANADGQLGSGAASAKEDVPTRVIGFL